MDEEVHVCLVEAFYHPKLGQVYVHKTEPDEGLWVMLLKPGRRLTRKEMRRALRWYMRRFPFYKLPVPGPSLN